MRKRRIILNSLPYILAMLVILCVRLASHNPLFVEKYYSQTIYPVIEKLFSTLSSQISFSLWDLFWILVVVLVISGLLLVVFKTIRFRWFILRITQLGALIYFFFYIMWGLNYFRPGIETRIGWNKPQISENIFRATLDSLISHTNKSYSNIKTSDYKVIDSLVEASYKKNSAYLGIKYPDGSLTPKKMIMSSYFALSDVNGYFGPFFSEVNLNYYLLPVDYPVSLAHERAHQFGFAQESEANLAAFIVCTTSDDKRLQYSGNMLLLLYFLKDAKQLNDYHEYIKKISKPVLRDIQFINQYYDRIQNKTLQKVQSAANNAYLKVNKIKSGVKNYNQVVALVISWYYNAGLVKDNY
jgi:hypothetical protein